MLNFDPMLEEQKARAMPTIPHSLTAARGDLRDVSQEAWQMPAPHIPLDYEQFPIAPSGALTALADEDGRPELQNVHACQFDGRAWLCATDGFRAHFWEAPVNVTPNTSWRPILNSPLAGLLLPREKASFLTDEKAAVLVKRVDKLEPESFVCSHRIRKLLQRKGARAAEESWYAVLMREGTLLTIGGVVSSSLALAFPDATHRPLLVNAQYLADALQFVGGVNMIHLPNPTDPADGTLILAHQDHDRLSRIAVIMRLHLHTNDSRNVAKGRAVGGKPKQEEEQEQDEMAG